MNLWQVHISHLTNNLESILRWKRNENEILVEASLNILKKYLKIGKVTTLLCSQTKPARKIRKVLTNI